MDPIFGTWSSDTRQGCGEMLMEGSRMREIAARRPLAGRRMHVFKTGALFPTPFYLQGIFVRMNHVETKKENKG